MPESDLEMTAMLYWAAGRVGLELRKRLCPEPLRLDEWFLRVACASSQRPAPGASLPEVHEELTGRGRHLLLPETFLHARGWSQSRSSERAPYRTSLGRAMSTLVVQERHLWLCLVDIGTPTSSVPVSQTGLFGDATGNMAQQFPAAQEQTEAIQHVLPRRAAAASTRPPVAAASLLVSEGGHLHPPPLSHRIRSSLQKRCRRGRRRQAAPPVLAPIDWW